MLVPLRFSMRSECLAEQWLRLSQLALVTQQQSHVLMSLSVVTWVLDPQDLSACSHFRAQVRIARHSLRAPRPGEILYYFFHGKEADKRIIIKYLR